MASLSVNIDITGAKVSRPEDVHCVSSSEERVCVYFPEPGVFLHGTPAELREFARQIVAKVGG